MARTTAVAEWSEEDEGFVVELDADELIAALHGEEATAAEAADELIVALPAPQVHGLLRAI